MTTRFSISLCISILLISCQVIGHKKYNKAGYRQDSLRVQRYIMQGDSIYAKKNNVSGFSKSMDLYDSAWQVAVQTNDTGLIAQAVFAKGRAYDAINDNPQKTIDYYTEAARLYSTISSKQNKALHIKHLVAHSYDKVQDSANCIRILKELYSEIITKPDSVKKQLRFIVEMGLISTVIKNYSFADSILQYLTNREWIKNDTSEYDYLNHYYLIRAKVDVLQNRNHKSIFLDSLDNVFAKSKNLNDSVYYSNELWELYKAMGNTEKGSYYLQVNNDVHNKFNSPESVREIKDKLAKMEVASVEAKRKAETDKAENRKVFIYVLTVLLIIISLLALFLVKRNREIRRRKREITTVNQQLYQKILQNELLNKEIHHRVKNNLQMILGLVYMQERKALAEETKEHLQEIRLRIESIARLHQQLMEQTDAVDLRKYIQYLVGSAASLMADDKKVITHLDIESLMVPQQISFPLGLVFNEWVTNSAKYARPVTGTLVIHVKISTAGKSIIINYKDNGAPQTQKNGKKSLGLDIINILTEQMGGALETSENLYEYKLTIPLPDGK